MYPFNLKAALAGAKVVTRNGEPVTQLHFFDGLPAIKQTIAGVVDQELVSWGADGRYQLGLYDSKFDLFMAEAPEQEIKQSQQPAAFILHPFNQEGEEVSIVLADGYWLRRWRDGNSAAYNMQPLYAGPDQAASVPDGWQLVPIEATRSMITAAGNILIDPYLSIRSAYSAMLAAAPKHTTVTPEQQK